MRKIPVNMIKCALHESVPSNNESKVYLEITRYEMTQSSCKRDTKSKSHSGMQLAPVRLFSCKHPLTRSPWGTLNLYHIPSFKMIYLNTEIHLNTEKQHTWVSHSRDKRHQTRGSKLRGFVCPRPRFNGLWSRKPRIFNWSFSIRDAKILVHRFSEWQSLSINCQQRHQSQFALQGNAASGRIRLGLFSMQERQQR